MSKTNDKVPGTGQRKSTRRSSQRVPVSSPGFDPELPINQRREELQQAIEAHQLIIVCGETGSGKSTQIPKMCLAIGRGSAGMICHTQPRRIAARSIAARLSSELGTESSSVVAHKIRFEDHTNDSTLIKVVTDGMLLSEIRGDRSLRQYDTIIIDEAHERSLNIDFLLGYLKQLLPRRPDLKLIVTSATIDPDSFSRYFNNAPVIEVSGRMFPVETRYRPAVDDPAQSALPIQIGNGLTELATETGGDKGDVLVFLPGERDIRETMEYLQKQQLPHTQLLPLYGRLAVRDQRKIFAPHRGRRIVLATNVAETSLTVPGITAVIDSGLARISRYSPARQVQRLPIEPVSQASAEQRKGRCGRVQSGICIRLFAEDDFDNRPEFTEPEVLRTSLAAVILAMLDLDFGDIQSFPFLDPPPARAINEGIRLLQELGAVDDKRQLTDTGRRLAHFPVDPRIARMLQASGEIGCLAEVLVIASFLSSQDPREHPQEALEAARAAHRKWDVESSDFLTILKLWKGWRKTSQGSTNRQRRDWLRRNFLAPQRMREWTEVHRQLGQLCQQHKMSVNTQAAEDDIIHRAVLAGLLGNIATKDERHEYLGTRGKRLFIHPGSATFGKSPKWIMAAELVDTGRLYARMVANIQPEWVEHWAGDLLSRAYMNPRWSKKQGRVMADVQLSLFGLIIVPSRTVHYGPVNPALCRELFIRHGLVGGEYDSAGEFLKDNRWLVEQVENLEHRTRKRDILADEQAQYHFYESRIPEGIADGTTFERWRTVAEQDRPGLLVMKEEDLLSRDTDDVTVERFPDQLEISGNHFDLTYHFEPGHANDGVSCNIPVSLLRQLEAASFDGLVPGLILEKIIALIKLLPKPLRRQCVPAPDVAEKCIDFIHKKSGADLPINEQLARALTAVTPTTVSALDIDQSRLPDHLRMNFHVLDENGERLASGRDLDLLKRQLGTHARKVFESATEESIERSGLSNWDFDELPEAVRLTKHGVTLAGYPALVDEQASVAIKVFDNPVEADEAGQRGLRRLLMLELSAETRYLEKNLPGLDRMALNYITMGSKSDLRDDLVNATVDRCFEINGSAIRTRLEYEERRHHGKPRMMSVANQLCSNIDKVLNQYTSLNLQLDNLALESRSDIRGQLAYLLYPGFITATPETWLRRYPVYLKGIQERVERANYAPEKDIQKMQQVTGLFDTMEECFDARWSDPGQARKFEEFRWMMEEYRLSVFAQRLKTVMPVSRKKLSQKANDLSPEAV